MRLGGSPDRGHLTYCTNIHPGVSWPEVRDQLHRHVPAIKASAAPDRPFGVGLRLAAEAARTLSDRAALFELEGLLAEHDLYVFTLNGFPYGPFHGTRVKEEVYQPDWTFAERVAYSDQLADILAQLLPEGLEGSISTVPGTFKPLAEAPGVPERIARNLFRHLAHLVEIERESGRRVALALEPEPHCMLETIAEVVTFFENQLLPRGRLAELREMARLGRGEAEDALRRHLGVCYDVCHAAVEFEDPAGSLEALRAAGIAVPKLQLSAALRLPRLDDKALAHLRAFDEAVYLHQVVERMPGGGLVRHLDLPDAFAALGGGALDEREWRVHFHVPVFLDRLEHFGTTQAFLGEILDLHRSAPISAHLEVETYTFDVLPEEYRDADVAEAIARELAWVQDRLAA
jgi:sugar phosphate isomerase/epimerase